MGDRFYTQQREAIGGCPGFPITNKRRRKLAWTEEKREEAIEKYTAAKPTAENSMEIVKQIAEELDESPNGVRTILSKAGVYIKTSPAASGTKATAAGKKDSTPRVSKDDAHAGLVAAITDAGAEVNEEVVTKLTGKAAIYLTEVLRKALG